jgi:hypothetical protein
VSLSIGMHPESLSNHIRVRVEIHQVFLTQNWTSATSMSSIHKIKLKTNSFSSGGGVSYSTIEKQRNRCLPKYDCTSDRFLLRVCRRDLLTKISPCFFRYSAHRFLVEVEQTTIEQRLPNQTDTIIHSATCTCTPMISGRYRWVIHYSSSSDLVLNQNTNDRFK